MTIGMTGRDFIIRHHLEMAKIFLTRALAESDPEQKGAYMQIYNVRLQRADMAKTCSKHAELQAMARNVIAERALLPEGAL